MEALSSPTQLRSLSISLIARTQGTQSPAFSLAAASAPCRISIPPCSTTIIILVLTVAGSDASILSLLLFMASPSPPRQDTQTDPSGAASASPWYHGRGAATTHTIRIATP